jgi:membrane-bound lytic murein transglycosylase F
MIAKDLKLRLELVVPPSHEQLIPWLLEGRGDLIAASLTKTPDREQQVAFSKPYLFTDELLVRKAGGSMASIKEPKDLCTKSVHVRASSAYKKTLEQLASKLGCQIKIVPESEEVETEETLEKVWEGVIPLTVADSFILDVERAYRSALEPVFAINGDAKNEIAFAVRPANKALRDYLDGFVKKTYRGVEYNVAKKKYFESPRDMVQALEKQDAKSGQLSKYDPIIRNYSKQYGFDWRLMAAQAYAESHFDPEAKSWVGAIGLFQVMPATGQSLGFSNLHDPDQGTHAGIKYVDQLMRQFEPDLDYKQRVRFALAAYNVGMGHVIDARRLAADRGLDPNHWFKNVEAAMLLLGKPQYAKSARHGFCRGTEPVEYVSRIQTSYDEYSKLLPP